MPYTQKNTPCRTLGLVDTVSLCQTLKKLQNLASIKRRGSNVRFSNSIYLDQFCFNFLKWGCGCKVGRESMFMAWTCQTKSQRLECIGGVVSNPAWVVWIHVWLRGPCQPMHHGSFCQILHHGLADCRLLPLVLLFFDPDLHRLKNEITCCWAICMFGG
jgi:hypothetical protein